MKSSPFPNKGITSFSEIEFVSFPPSLLKSTPLNAFVEGFCLGFFITVICACHFANGFHNNSAMLIIRIHVLRHIVQLSRYTWSY